MALRIASDAAFHQAVDGTVQVGPAIQRGVGAICLRRHLLNERYTSSTGSR